MVSKKLDNKYRVPPGFILPVITSFNLIRYFQRKKTQLPELEVAPAVLFKKADYSGGFTGTNIMPFASLSL